MKRKSNAIDSLFREGMEKRKENASFREEDWTAMERRLDQHDRRRRVFFWFRTFSGIAIILVLSLLLWPGPDPERPGNRVIPENNARNEKTGTGQVAGRPGDGSTATAPVAERSGDESTTPVVEITMEQNKIQNGASQDRNGKKEPGDQQVVRQFPGQDVASGPGRLVLADKPDIPTKKNVSDRINIPERVNIPHSVGPGDKTSNIPAMDTAAPAGIEKNIPSKGETKTEKPTAIAPSSKQKFYYGPLVGPDLSMIRSQKVKNAGYSVGLLIGYRFNDRWAVETGVLWAKKRYYTNGEHFNKYNVGIPHSAELLSLDGSCGMFALPVVARYDFRVDKRSFFAAAGLSSYLMKNESYDYLVDNSGSTYKSHKSYENSGNHLFSNMQFSAGYNHALSRKLTLRIEPYINLPLKQIGTGKIHLTSTGVYAGFIFDRK
ncbi:MAG TPA: porin family protein [Flavitalea sp.]|nr:porin family protein [Flavitalea sp.]